MKEIHVANIHIKKCLSLLATKEIQIKTHQDSIAVQSDWQSLRKQKITNSGEDVQGWEWNPHILLVEM
jgi:hypothetical protein